MGGSGTQPAAYYRPAEVAKLLRCSEWWIKEQARRRRIPYAWIGGSYLFTAEHIAEIVRLFEVKPASSGPAIIQQRPRVQAHEAAGDALVLRARRPRRSRTDPSGSVAA